MFARTLGLRTVRSMGLSVAILCAFLLTSYIAVPSGTASAAPVITLNGELLETSVPPVVHDGRIMIPIQDLTPYVEGNIFFHPGSGILRFISPTVQFTLMANNRTVFGPGELPEQSIAPWVAGENMLVSIRFIADVFGWQLEWDEESRTVNLSPVQPLIEPEPEIYVDYVPDAYEAIHYEPTTEEIQLLIRLTSSEAPYEPFDGKVAVAAVVLNRVRSTRFPNTIREVIYQPGQFCVVDNGQINRAITPGTESAVWAALAGNDPSSGALFFFNPAKISRSSGTWAWIQTLTILKEIGCHQFAR